MLSDWNEFLRGQELANGEAGLAAARDSLVLAELSHWGLIAFTGVGFWLLYGSIGADIIDYDELEHGQRREGAFTASANWILKVGFAVGIGASGLILGATGFDEKLGGAQSPDTIFAIRFWLAAIPVIGLMIALVVLLSFGLTRERVLEIRQQLEARRGKV